MKTFINAVSKAAFMLSVTAAVMVCSLYAGEMAVLLDSIKKR